jgi:hypothetical protein
MQRLLSSFLDAYHLVNPATAVPCAFAVQSVQLACSRWLLRARFTWWAARVAVMCHARELSSRSGACACSALAAPVVTRGSRGRAGELKAAAMEEDALDEWLDDALWARALPDAPRGPQRVVQPPVERVLFHCRRLELACAPAAVPRHPCSALAARWWLAAAAAAAAAGGRGVPGASTLWAWVFWLAAPPCHPLTCWLWARHAGWPYAPRLGARAAATSRMARAWLARVACVLGVQAQPLASVGRMLFSLCGSRTQ